MFPTICKIGPLTIYSYGLMIAVAAIVCTWLLSRDARHLGISSDTISDLMFWIVVFGLIGARMLYVLLNLDYFMPNPLEMVMIQNGGLAWQGGLIIGTIAGLLFVKKRKLNLKTMLDLCAPYVALGESIGRVGCLLNGCCYGKEVGWGLYFPIHHARLHPTQIYTSLGLLSIFVILRWYQKQSESSTTGSVFVLYLVLASALRYFVEFFRADHVEILWGLSIFQLVCLLLLLTACYILLRFVKPKK
ncbi:MAG: prolipoprotein diacylglyceryl transferase [Candidatus Omnitrophica bacterium]|nr:prolipoprotein diacylglyceryl transferase [Candidatus Omnitrophota bacterium]